MPVLLGPIGYSRMMHCSYDVAGTSAATKAGAIFAVSSMSGHALEERVLALLREDIDRTMRLLGVRSVVDLNGSVVRLPQDFAAS